MLPFIFLSHDLVNFRKLFQKDFKFITIYLFERSYNDNVFHTMIDINIWRRKGILLQDLFRGGCNMGKIKSMEFTIL